MLYFIGGSPRVGKSILAKKIAELKNATVLSTDQLCDRVTKDLSPEEKKQRFPFPGFSGDASKNTYSPEEYTRLQFVSMNSLQPAIENAIAQAAFKKEPTIIEGIHLMPNHIRMLVDTYGSDNCSVVFIGSIHVEQLIEGIMQDTRPSNWMKESPLQVIRQFAQFACVFSSVIREEALRNNFTYLERSEDFDQDIQQAIDLLSKQS